MNTEELTHLLHDTYEAAAIKHGWKSNTQVSVPWAHVPAENKAAMRDAVAVLEEAIREDERAKYYVEVVQSDLRAVMKALGISTHARSSSPHDVVQNEILPRIRNVMQYSPETIQSEIRQIMSALNVNVDKRSPSPNEMIQGEILPKIRKMKKALSQTQASIEKHYTEVKEILDKV